MNNEKLKKEFGENKEILKNKVNSNIVGNILAFLIMTPIELLFLLIFIIRTITLCLIGILINLITFEKKPFYPIEFSLKEFRKFMEVYKEDGKKRVVEN